MEVGEFCEALCALEGNHLSPVREALRRSQHEVEIVVEDGTVFIVSVRKGVDVA